MGATGLEGFGEVGASTWTVLLSTWAAMCALWSIFTEPHRTFAARSLLFQPAWILRIIIGDETWVQDLGLFLGLHSIYSWSTGAWVLWRKGDFWWLDINDETLQVYLQLFAILGGCGLLAGTIVHRGHKLASKEANGRFREHPIEESLLPPLLITSRTSHSRMFPEKHAFSYSYLFAGVPIGVQGRIGNVLSIDSPRPAWFDVQSKDYLKRGNDHLILGEKMKRYLHSQGVTDRDYAFAYLVTAPRFLGYSFNPVSFWYIYDSDTSLKYMILEVNNTFDERRMYLLKSDKSPSDDGAPDGLHFTDAWAKDFHVSPFNSRKGSYSLKATDPLAAFEKTGHVKIDNTIVLRSSKDHPKIVARVWSEAEPTDPKAVTTFQLTRFIAAWWWVGLATFPRIVWEAQKLFFKRRLHVWYRPEIDTNSIGRSYTDGEEQLEEMFRSFLTEAVEHAGEPLRVIYEPAHHDDEEIVLYSPNFTYQEDHGRTLTIKITSPAFYSRFIHYAHAKEAFDRESLATDDKNRTCIIQDAHLLPVLLESLRDIAHASKPSHPKQTFLNSIRWNLVKRLRCPPAAASYPSDASRLDQEYAVEDIRSFQFSEFDRYVQQSAAEADAYRRIALKLFAAERFAFGLPVLVAVGDWTIRAMLILAALAFADTSRAFDLLRPGRFAKVDFVQTALLMLAANAVHLWSFVKG